MLLFRHCLYSFQTVNTASRMESTGKKGKIQCSEQTKELLVAGGKEKWVKARDELIEAKGKGSLQTYWVERPQMSRTDSTVSSSKEEVTEVSRTDSMVSSSKDEV